MSMKRFFSLLMVCMAVLSVWALPSRNERLSVGLPGETLPAMFDIQGVKCMPAAANEDTIRLETAAIVWRRYADAWYVGAIDKDSMYVFYFYYPSETLSGSFTESDLNAKYSYMYDYSASTRQQYAYTKASLHIEQVSEGVSLNAKIEANGKHYTLTGFEKAIVPKDTVEYVFPEANMQKGSMGVVIDGEIEGEVIASALIYTTDIVGTYTSEDFEMVYSTFVRFPNKPNEKDSTFVDAMDCSAVVTLENGAYHFDISLLGQDTVLYHLQIYHPITITDTINIAINNLSIDLSAVGFMNTFFLDGSNDDYTLTIACEGTGADGIYQGAQTVSTTITDNQTGQIIRSVNTKLNLYTVGGVREADAEVYGNDDKFYRIHLVFTIPTAKDTVSITFDQKGEGIYYREDGTFYMYNEDSRYIVAMEVYTDQPEGEYERGDFRPRYTYIGVINGADTTGVMMYTASATITQQGQDYAVEAEILGTDTVLYQVCMAVNYRYVAIQYDETSGSFVQNYTDADNVSLNARYFATDGYVSLTALSRSGKLTYLEFLPKALDDETTIPVGSYTIDASGAQGTVNAGQGIMSNTIVGSVCGDYTQQGMTVPCFFVATGTVTVERKDAELLITVDAQNTNGLPIKVTYRGTSLFTAIDAPQAESTRARKLIRNGQVYILRGETLYTLTGQRVNQ